MDSLLDLGPPDALELVYLDLVSIPCHVRLGEDLSFDVAQTIHQRFVGCRAQSYAWVRCWKLDPLTRLLVNVDYNPWVAAEPVSLLNQLSECTVDSH